MDDCNGCSRLGVTLLYARSDSSMDDCNGARDGGGGCGDLVQIPLWTIVTGPRAREHPAVTGSDSSMDDCNARPERGVLRWTRVQIPLWTIVTSKPEMKKEAV